MDEFHFESPEHEAAKLRELSKSLQGLRDALMNTSLFLHDLKFQMDEDSRRQLEVQTSRLLAGLKGV